MPDKKESPEIDRTVLASIRGCQDTTNLQGAACTNRCSNRETCRLRRTKLLIHAEAFDVDHTKDWYTERGKRRYHIRIKTSYGREKGVVFVELGIKTPVPDDYVNDIFDAVT